METAGFRFDNTYTRLPGAVLVRVAASHIRVGTFEFASLTRDVGNLRALVD